MVIFVLLAAVEGCGKYDNPAGTIDTDRKASISLREIDEKQLDSVIAGCHGKVVLVDYWATWCLSCVELFSHTVELHEKYGPKGLVVISVSLDDSDNRNAALDFLEEHEAVFDNFISVYGAGTESLEKFDLPGPLPQLQIFDREGKLRKSFPQPQSSIEKGDVDKAVRKWLGEG